MNQQHQSSWYDDLASIEKMETLDQLNELLYARMEACDIRGAQLKNVVLFGRLFFADDGRCFALDAELSPEQREKVRRVMDADDFLSLLPQKPLDIHNMLEELDAVPTSENRCSYCHRGWTLETCGDIDAFDEYLDLPVGEHVGRTLADVMASLTQPEDGVFELRENEDDEVCIRPATLSPFEDLCWKVGKETLGRCPDQKWLDRLLKVDIYTYAIRAGDVVVDAVKRRYFHRACFDRFAEEKMKPMFDRVLSIIRAVLSSAGFTAIQLHVPESLPDEIEHLLSHGIDPIEWIHDHLHEDVAYVHVETNEGRFGLLFDTHFQWWIDLHALGMTPTDFGVDPANIRPAGLCLLPVDPNFQCLRTLREKLEQR